MDVDIEEDNCFHVYNPIFKDKNGFVRNESIKTLAQALANLIKSKPAPKKQVPAKKLSRPAPVKTRVAQKPVSKPASKKVAKKKVAVKTSGKNSKSSSKFKSSKRRR